MIKCVAIDDEPIALSIIQEYCKSYGNIDLKTFTSPIEGMECIKSTLPDIVFLDIEMNSHNGVALAKELPEDTCLIFTTAYSEYALDGFNADAVDFLHKPIFYPRFERAIEKARRFMKHEIKDNAPGAITMKVERKNVVVNFKDIILIEAMDNYVKVYRKDLPMIISQITMKEMESLLSPEAFIRVHRSFIVAIDSIERFANKIIYLHNHPQAIPVGRKYLQTLNDLKNSFKNSPLK